MLKVELLNSQHNQADFDCGNEELNAYLKQIADNTMTKAYHGLLC